MKNSVKSIACISNTLCIFTIWKHIKKKSKTQFGFEIFQAKNGGIYVRVWNSVSELSLKQINELHIESMFYEFQNFSQEDYIKHYKIKTNA